MIFKTLNKTDSKLAMEEWISTSKIPNMTEEYRKIREDLLVIFLNKSS